MVSLARATRGRGEGGKLPSLDARSRRPIQVPLLERGRGDLMISNAVFQKMESPCGVRLGMEGYVEAGLRQGQTKELALARAVFNQQDGRMDGHESSEQTNSWNDLAGIVPKENGGMVHVKSDDKMTGYKANIMSISSAEMRPTILKLGRNSSGEWRFSRLMERRLTSGGHFGCARMR